MLAVLFEDWICIWNSRTVLLKELFVSKHCKIHTDAKTVSFSVVKYSSPPLIGTPFTPNNSALISKVSFCEREDWSHS